LFERRPGPLWFRFVRTIGIRCNAYLRRRGYPPDQAQDLTQEFFIRVLVGRYLDRAHPEKGRFRSFLLSSLKLFVADVEDRDRTHKRGGGALVPLEFSSGEERYRREPAHDETPERIFERRWALAVLDRVVERLRNEFVQHGRPEHFERLKVFLLGQSDAPYAALACEMNTSEGALKVAIHRRRKRYREIFRQEIADTVANPAEVEAELRYLAILLTRKWGRKLVILLGGFGAQTGSGRKTAYSSTCFSN
jgi:DNA-directed RNA polymerase specialized sigma24 family protein